MSIRFVPIALMVAGMATGCASDTDGEARAPGESETMTVSGTITVLSEGAGDVWGEPEDYNGEPCEPDDGFDDINDGAQVVVYDKDGTKVGLGAVGEGVTIYDSREGSGARKWPFECVLPFTVTDVPKSEGIYSLEIGSRGQVEFTPEEAGNIRLTLGEE